MQRAESVHLRDNIIAQSSRLPVDEIAKAVSSAVSSVLSEILRDDEKSSADSSGEDFQTPIVLYNYTYVRILRCTCTMYITRIRHVEPRHFTVYPFRSQTVVILQRN